MELEEVKVVRLQHLEAVLELRDRRLGRLAEQAGLAAEEELVAVRRERRPERERGEQRRRNILVAPWDLPRRERSTCLEAVKRLVTTKWFENTQGFEPKW